jgi:hypothetical protein
MQAAPGSPFEVIEAKFLLELLMGLLAEPARLNGGGEDFQRRLGRQVREVVLVLACLAQEPDLLLAWEVLVRPFSSVRDERPALVAAALAAFLLLNFAVGVSVWLARLLSPPFVYHRLASLHPAPRCDIGPGVSPARSPTTFGRGFSPLCRLRGATASSGLT